MKRIPLFLFTLLIATSAFSQKVTVSGYVTDAKSGEALIGVSVFCAGSATGTITNNYGYYALEIIVPCEVTFQYMGFETHREKLTDQAKREVSVKLAEQKNELKEVVVKGDSKDLLYKPNETGMIRLQMKELSTVPAIGGERDIMKVLQLMPGVKRGSDGSTGMMVRGGTADQNLILLDEAPLYNASHLLGFFSIFNSDALKDVTLMKGGFDARYGGRLSSIMDVRMKEGNNQKIKAEGGVGILASRLTIDGPIVKDKMTFMISGRRTYIDQAFRVVGEKLPYYFYDVNAKINYKVGKNDHLYVSSYIGDDVLNLVNPTDSSKKNEQARIDFGSVIRNRLATFRWNHVYPGNRLFSNISFISNSFDYKISAQLTDNIMQIQSSITDQSVKSGFDYYRNNKEHYRFGTELTFHHFRPNISKVQGDFNEQLKTGNGLSLYTQEIAAYGSVDYRLSSRWNTTIGLRLSSASTQQKIYINPEPRFILSYQWNSTTALKGSYTRMYQYMHLVSGTSIMPTDLWYPVTNHVRPQQADQLSFSFEKSIESWNTLISIEPYYKWMNNLVEYREGTVVMLNNAIEKDLVQGTGKSYGIEFLAHKRQGKWNGWVGYTLSWSTRQFDELNHGKEFYTRYDRRHDISIVSNYDISKRITFSVVWVFATGSRFTPVVGKYLMPNGNYTSIDVLPIYSDRNAVQLSASHRLDVNLVIRCKPAKRWQSEWHIGAYNVYNRTQPYRITIQQDARGNLAYKQVGLFGFIPSVTYNFKF